MPTRVLSIFLLLFLLCASFSCTTGNDEPEPTKELIDLTGRWDVHTWESTTYDEKGGIESAFKSYGRPGDYYEFSADKSFQYHSEDLGVISGTYTYTKTSMTMTYQRGTFAGFHDITVFTPTQLELTSGKQQASTRSNVQLLTLVKH